MMLMLVMILVSTLVWERARERDQPKYFMAKEQTVEADLLIPILQWTRTFPPICFAPWMKLYVSSQYFSRSVSSTSHSLMFRYLNTAGKKLSISLVMLRICVTPLLFSSSKLEAFHSLPKNRKSKILEAGSIWPKINKISSSMKAFSSSNFSLRSASSRKRIDLVVISSRSTVLIISHSFLFLSVSRIPGKYRQLIGRHWSSR